MNWLAYLLIAFLAHYTDCPWIFWTAIVLCGLSFLVGMFKAGMEHAKEHNGR